VLGSEVERLASNLSVIFPTRLDTSQPQFASVLVLSGSFREGGRPPDAVHSQNSVVPSTA
jgi:hypothetical protein